MDATNAVIEASAMIATFPLKVQASLADDNATSGIDFASTIVTLTPSQVGFLTHHNRELHHLQQIAHNEVTTDSNQRNTLQETATQLVEQPSKLMEDLAN